MIAPRAEGSGHVERLSAALVELDLPRIADWGRRLARLGAAGRRVLVAGNGGSAAQAQHLTAELVGRFERDRMPISALALHADTSSVTAIGNDYGYDQVFARQVRAHARPGDVLLLLSGSGRSANLLRAADAAREVGAITWALTGPTPNPLAALVDEAVSVPAETMSTVQECHLVAVHLMCTALDDSPHFGRNHVAESPVSLSEAAAPGAADRGPRQHGRQRLTVVGDAFLDRDHVGRVERVTSDEPALVVSGGETRDRPGGAALAAVLCAHEGHVVTLVTALGQDPVGDQLRELLGSADVEVVDLGLAGPTAVKTRIRAAGRTLVMLDEQDVCSPVGHAGAAGLAAARAALHAAKGVLVSDYGRGITAHSAVRAALSEAASYRPLVWDPHPRGAAPVRGTAVVTPNGKEAGLIGSVLGGPDLLDAVAAARAVQRAWGQVRVALTRGEDGAVLVTDADLPPMVVPTNAAAGRDVDACGAGDRFAGHLTAMLASGALPTEAVIGAVHAASAYVAAGGPRRIDGVAPQAGSEVPDCRDGTSDAIALARAVKARGGTVVATGGCFDLLHVGHVRLLEVARTLGDCLIVCLNSDECVSRLKGPSRPIVPAAQRVAILEALASVDAVLVFGEDTPESAIRALRPDIWVKGGDYSMMELPEAELVASLGGQVMLAPYVGGYSTTSLIDVVRAAR